MCCNGMLFNDEETPRNTKKCIYCGEEKAFVDFPKHAHYKDNLDNRCRSCIKKHTKVRSTLHKIAPPKPKLCQCCKTIPKKWCLDHDHNTNEIRGWLCDQCNTGIGKLGDNLNGIMNAVKYLKKVKSKKKK